MDLYAKRLIRAGKTPRQAREESLKQVRYVHSDRARYFTRQARIYLDIDPNMSAINFLVLMNGISNPSYRKNRAALFFAFCRAKYGETRSFFSN